VESRDVLADLGQKCRKTVRDGDGFVSPASGLHGRDRDERLTVVLVRCADDELKLIGLGLEDDQRRQDGRIIAADPEAGSVTKGSLVAAIRNSAMASAYSPRAM